MNATTGRPKVRITADDPSLTPFAGLMHVGELVHRLSLIEHIDARLPHLKQRHRGLSPGEFVVAVAEAILAGAECLTDLDVLRADHAGAMLRAVSAPPAPTTAGQYFRRFRLRDLWELERASAEAANELDVRQGLAPGAVTLDADSTWCEVFGAGKQGAGWSYQSALSYQPFLVAWAERRRVLAADLLAGNDGASAPARAPRLLARALALLPERRGEVVLRADAGFHASSLVAACRRSGVRFSISAKRTSAIWREIAGIPADAWRPAIDMTGAEVAETTHKSRGMGVTRLIVRRVALDADAVARSRSSRRRTIPKEQLQLALEGEVATVYAYSAIITDLAGEPRDIEHFHRQRAAIEELIKDAKLGAALRRMPMGTRRANAAWMHACLLAANLSSMLSQISGGAVRAHGKRLRRELIRIPARLVRSGRRLRLRLPAALAPAAAFAALYAAILALGPPA